MKPSPETTFPASIVPRRDSTLRSFSFTTSDERLLHQPLGHVALDGCPGRSASPCPSAPCPCRNPLSGTSFRISVNSSSIRRETSSAGISTVIFFSTPRNGVNACLHGFPVPLFLYWIVFAGFWCERRDLNPHGCPPDPKSGASAIPPLSHCTDGAESCRIDRFDSAATPDQRSGGGVPVRGAGGLHGGASWSNRMPKMKNPGGFPTRGTRPRSLPPGSAAFPRGGSWRRSGSGGPSGCRT